MTTLTLHITHLFPRIQFQPIQTLLKWNENYRSRQAFMNLDQHALQDMGISNDQRAEKTMYFAAKMR